ncbi:MULTISPECIES: bifunctional 4-hydroxy-2-oxoglutarate aldolase/2-dehydro-3-deoxy-phosphogluconate aldolase [unclassified Cyanobium]|uniref:bifunctional 4-hydroxy-2-oxoglutarate aldolase/2-dehydro-3-deoxy-phosphogluconate aldolase n=1 Tax=unclassified Cyanobium TaxID=2627006 RepID=UPI0020CEBBB3|nr:MULTISPECIES: bifunctional 4-hydroxy-2-oxoglutarate aldolase/2-dehydro-3-deoxy-phosphogluconate aldolase [unclassified Cyanobium]MCP9835812.1 bifunctional 4-hydroxy-2-oxoglutarate aldolase/2-dehydro-3-deoxy-phosphogluconate aldolase [Cyanobium sp. La Preciosa 7G6]MCP9938578.1 bifunctional 4-hydroxy-2-oxoglutarate aldolase/2-dehydro-3-deoxy-phosphogluconate aldolase [Cyanobium sp. Aljojuca 7A6]
MHHQPLLVVLRHRQPSLLVPQLEQLLDLGVRHVEIAWSPGADWIAQGRQLIAAFPDLRLGASSICSTAALESVLEAGFAYGVSPILDGALLERSAAAGFVLVPGVMTPTEVNQARALGCSIVKLFPATTVGIGHWRRLREPLGTPLPFCIAAGGLKPSDVRPWLEAGVDAVALGASFAAEPVRQLLVDLNVPP